MKWSDQNYAQDMFVIPGWGFGVVFWFVFWLKVLNKTQFLVDLL